MFAIVDHGGRRRGKKEEKRKKRGKKGARKIKEREDL